MRLSSKWLVSCAGDLLLKYSLYRQLISMSEVDFDSPALAIVLNDSLHVFNRID